MDGEKELGNLIRQMQPLLNPGDYVFCTSTHMEHIPLEKIVAWFREKEGITVVVPKQIADDLNLSYRYIVSWISLQVHSSLNAVGFTALFSECLAREGISCNVMAGYYHDHIFVPKDKAESAMRALKKLSRHSKVQ